MHPNCFTRNEREGFTHYGMMPILHCTNTRVGYSEWEMQDQVIELLKQDPEIKRNGIKIFKEVPIHCVNRRSDIVFVQ